MSENTQQLLTREQLAQEHNWAIFPVDIQEKLFLHYQQFIHDGDYHMAKMDVQSVSDTLQYLMAGSRLDTLLIEHRTYFGQASTEDLVGIALHLVTLIQPL